MDIKPSLDELNNICVICGDRATGKHYGATSCDGCKGFFRRSVRKKHNYICRFDQSCIVDKDHRNTCRRCRYEACIKRGMKKDAVQNERDSIAQADRMDRSSPPSSTNSATLSTAPSVPSTPPTSQLDKLIEAEIALRSLRSSVITKTSDARKEATTGDVTDSMHQQLLLLVEWAKKLDAFTALAMGSQISLMRAFAAQHLVFCAAYRSTHLSDSLWLTNDTCLPKDSSIVPDVNRVAERVVDHLAVSIRNLRIKHFEYVALKGIAFFEPLACPRDAVEDRARINEIREQLLVCLENRLTQEQYPSPSLRQSRLLLILPTMVSVSRDLIEDVQLAKVFGLADIDFFMSELLIPPTAKR